jgi:hypothetical protein
MGASSFAVTVLPCLALGKICLRTSHISFNLLEGNEKVKPNDDTDEMMIGDA